MAQRLPWSAPQLPASFAGAGGTATPSDVMAASFDQMTFVDNTTAASDSLVEAYEDLRRDVKAATGTDLGNPMLAPAASLVPNPLTMFGGAPMATDIVAEQRLRFQQQVNDLAARYPAEAVKDWAQRDPVQAAEAIARQADEKLGTVMASRPGWDSFVYAFGGAAAGAMRDPVTIGTLFLGGGPGGARTALGRVLATAGTEAAVNAGVEAAMQPWVQGWRAQAGLESGFDQAIANVAFAAGFGGVLGAGGRGALEAVDFARLTPEQRAAVPPVVRGAIDAGDMLATIDAQRPPEIQPRRHEDLLTQAELIAHRQPIGAVLEADDVQVNRIVEQLAPSAGSIGKGYVPRVGDDFAATLDTIRTGDPAGATSSARPVLRYLANIGGVDPASPIAAELRAVGITSRDMPGLFKAGGRQSLDNVPVDQAAEAFPGRADLDDGNGYVRQQAFLDAAQLEVERKGASFDAVQDERGYWERNGVDFERQDDRQILDRMAAIADAEERYRVATDAAGDVDEAILLPPGLTRRAYTEQAVREAVKLAGPGVTDDVIRKAVDLHLVERESLADAVDWAMSDKAGVSRQLPAPALEGIGSSPPVPRGDLVDPDIDDDWGADLDALQEWASSEGLDDIAVPFGDVLMTPAALKAELDKAAALERVVAACKLY